MEKPKGKLTPYDRGVLDPGGMPQGLSVWLSPIYILIVYIFSAKAEKNLKFKTSCPQTEQFIKYYIQGYLFFKLEIGMLA